MKNYVHILRRLDAVIKAYRRAEDACYRATCSGQDSDRIEQHWDIFFALQDKRDALRDQIRAYVAHPVRVRRFADDFVDGQWHVEYGRYLIRRQQILTACRLLGVDSRQLRF